MKRVKTVLILVFIIIINLLFSCRDIVFDNPLDPNASKAILEVIRVIETILSGRGDITFDGEKIWKIDSSGFLSAVDRESGMLLRSFSAVPGTGVGFLKDQLYICDQNMGNTLVTIDPLSGDIINRISTQEIYPGFLTTDNDQLIIFDERSSGIFSYDPETGNAFRWFEISGVKIGGIALYKGDLLLTDINTNSIYQFSMNGEIIGVFNSPSTGVSGICVDSSYNIYLFMLDGKIYKVSLP